MSSSIRQLWYRKKLEMELCAVPISLGLPGLTDPLGAVTFRGPRWRA